MKPVAENESRHLGQNEMAGLKGKSGPPGNMNAFKHGLAAIQKRREEGIPTEHEGSALSPFMPNARRIFNPACVLMSRNRFESEREIPNVFLIPSTI
jgi:hypothetical protein